MEQTCVFLGCLGNEKYQRQHLQCRNCHVFQMRFLFSLEWICTSMHAWWNPMWVLFGSISNWRQNKLEWQHWWRADTLPCFCSCSLRVFFLSLFLVDTCFVLNHFLHLLLCGCCCCCCCCRCCSCSCLKSQKFTSEYLTSNETSSIFWLNKHSRRNCWCYPSYVPLLLG